MNHKPTYQYIFDLLEYSNDISSRIKDGEPDNGNYFMTLIYVEDILDKYGRSMVNDSANDDHQDGHALMVEATRQMDLLRSKITELSNKYNFNDILTSRSNDILRNWRKEQPQE